jgi:hypothetical protein
MTGSAVAAATEPQDPKRFGNLDAKDQLAAYASLRVYESDYDRAQGTLRVVASTWILAIVGALGFLVCTHPARAALRRLGDEVKS